MTRSVLILLIFTLFGVLAEPIVYENSNVIKTVDLTKPIVKVILRLTVHTIGTENAEYVVAIPKHDFDHLSYIEANSSKKMPLSIKFMKMDEENGVALYSIGNPKEIVDKSVFSVTYYLTHVLESLPAYVKQDETPKYVYNDLLMVQSPYTTLSQEIRYKLPSSSYESVTKDAKLSVQDSVITYGPYASMDPFSSKKTVRLHFSSLAHFITFDKVEREIEVSHWGNVAIEEVIHARNSGTPLTGEFSRLDYFKSDPDQISAWEILTGRIDKRAFDIYYRDIIGNITTSNVRKEADGVNVELTMRFPMMGGWKNEFYWGYNLPSGRVLKKQGSRFSLKVPYSTPITNADVRELSVRVILPECVKNVRFVLPEGVAQPTLDYRYTYLDSKR